MRKPVVVVMLMCFVIAAPLAAAPLKSDKVCGKLDLGQVSNAADKLAKKRSKRIVFTNYGSQKSCLAALDRSARQVKKASDDMAQMLQGAADSVMLEPYCVLGDDEAHYRSAFLMPTSSSSAYVLDQLLECKDGVLSAWREF